MRKRNFDLKLSDNTDPYVDKSKGKKVRYSEDSENGLLNNQSVKSNIPVKLVMSRVLRDVTNSQDVPSPPPLTNESSLFQSPALSSRVFNGMILSNFYITILKLCIF